MLFLSVAIFNISIYRYKIEFDITRMISWGKFGTGLSTLGKCHFLLGGGPLEIFQVL